MSSHFHPTGPEEPESQKGGGDLLLPQILISLGENRVLSKDLVILIVLPQIVGPTTGTAAQ